MTPAELTAAREALGLSQVDLSLLLGIHPTILNRWEHDRAKIPPYLQLALHGLAHTGGWQGRTTKKAREVYPG